MLDERTKQIKHFLAVLSIQFIVIDLAIIVQGKLVSNKDHIELF